MDQLVVEKLRMDVLDLERALVALADRRDDLRRELSERRKELADARRREKSGKPVRDEKVMLAETRNKLRVLRVSAANALRTKGATIREVEAVVGVSYSVVAEAERRLKRLGLFAGEDPDASIVEESCRKS